MGKLKRRWVRYYIRQKFTKAIFIDVEANKPIFKKQPADGEGNLYWSVKFAQNVVDYLHSQYNINNLEIVMRRDSLPLGERRWRMQRGDSPV